jgi:hypothetical protein
MTDRKLMQQALEALIKAHPYSNSNKDLDGHSEAIAALGERLAQPEPLQRFTDVQQEIEAALTPEQDPVAYVLRTLSSKSISDEIAPTGWSTFESKIEKLRADPWVQNGIAEIVPLYTSPQQREWQGLTDDEVKTMAKDTLYCIDDYYHGDEVDGVVGWKDFARAVETKLKEKNT